MIRTTTVLSVVALFAAASLSVVSPVGAQSTFIPTSGTTSWGTAANWDTNTVPSGIDVSVAFPSPTAAEIVNLDGARTVGSISITNNSNPAVAFTLANGTGGSLIFDTSGANASLTVSGTGLGVSTLSASTTLNKTLAFNITNTAPVSASGAFSMIGSMAGTGGVIKDGAGTMSFTTAAKTYTGATTVNQGVLRYTATGASTGTTSIAVNSGGQLRLDSSAGAFSFGSAVITLNGTGAGTSVGALLNANTGAVTLANSIALASDATISTTSVATGASFQLNGSISGAGQLTKAGAGNLILNGSSNTYSGGTIVSAGTLTILRDGGLGSSNISLAASGVTLTLQGAATNNYINDNASISLVTGSTLNLNFTGVPDTVSAFVINGVFQPAGIYDATTTPGLITGTGSINNLAAIPEPATYMLFGVGLLACLQRFRRSKKQ